MLLPPALGSSPYPPVSVYGTGPARTIVAFLGSPSGSFPTLVRSASQQTFPLGDLPPSHIHCLHRSFHSRLLLSACVPTVLSIGSTGLSTCCPSPTLFSLSLGPGFPRADQLYSGNLWYSAVKILTSLSLLIPAFSLHGSPLLLSVQLLSAINAPLPDITPAGAMNPWLR